MASNEQNSRADPYPISGVDSRFWIDLRNTSDLDRVSVSSCGGKADNLAKLIRLDLPTPQAVVLTTEAWSYFMRDSGAAALLNAALEDFADRPHEVDQAAAHVSRIITRTALPETLLEQIRIVYLDLSAGSTQRIAIRSSGSYEDSREASFSGMLSTVLGVYSEDEAVAAVKKCWSSGFNARSLRYLVRKGLDPAGMAVALIFQRMVKAKSSGVLFTVDPASGDTETAVVEAAYGYGPAVVSGDVTPDLYRVSKKDLRIEHRELRPQEHYYVSDGSRREVGADLRSATKLSDEEVVTLVSYGMRAEQELGGPQDIEWCRDDRGLVLLQTRPVTGLEKLSLKQKAYTRPEIVMVRGIGVSPRVGWGEVMIFEPESHEQIPSSDFDGKVVVLRRLTQDLAPRFKGSAGVVADEGGATSHGANILREFQVPCVVGTRYAMAVMHDGDVVTVDGWRGLVLDGIGPRVKESEFGTEQLVPTRTRLMTTINMPESAEKAAAIADGVISFRNDYLLLQGGVHPAVLMRRGKGSVLTNAVFEALRLVAGAFRGKPVWYKSLDAPTDEFRRLRGGEDEPLERNPLLGWRGIRREMSDASLLRAEYEAVKMAIAEGHENIGIKVPFIRRPDEYQWAREIAVSVGLEPHENVFFGASIETPAAVMRLDEILAAQVDFISVGVNDLTMCTLGVDRESEMVAELFEPTDPAVLSLLEDVAAKAVGKAFVAAAGDIAQNPALMEKLVGFGYEAIGISLPYLGTARSHVAKVEENQA